MPSAMSATRPTIVMPAASAPTVMMAATSAPHMPVTMTVATAHQNGIDAGLRSDGRQRRHRHRRGREHGHYRQCAECRGSDQQKTIHLTFLPWAAVARRRVMSLTPGSSVQPDTGPLTRQRAVQFCDRKHAQEKGRQTEAVLTRS